MSSLCIDAVIQTWKVVEETEEEMRRRGEKEEVFGCN